MSFDRVFSPASIPAAAAGPVKSAVARRPLLQCLTKMRAMLQGRVANDPVTARPAGLRRALLATLLLCTLSAQSVSANSIRLLRDADVEHALGELARPVLTAAGLNANRLRVLVVDDQDFNAFVIDQRAIFINYGLILKTTTPEMLQAVIAHEAAHIANGHIGRRSQNLRSAGTAAGFGAALAVLAAAAGAGEAAIGVAAGAQTSALRSFLAHTRAEESSADRSAIAFLSRAGIPARGMLEVHRLFAGQEVLSARNQDPYMRSHPLSRDRIRAAEAFVAAAGQEPPPRPQDDYWLARARAKLSAFTRAPSWTLRRRSEEKYEDIRQMRSAIAYHRQNDFAAARKQMQALLAAHPDDAFYHELWGQILFENRRWNEALAAYRDAVRHAGDDPLILAALGRAELAAGQPAAALKTMESARNGDFRNAALLRDMSAAYAKTNQPGMAALVTAERYALQGRLEDAGPHAKRASAILPTGSPGWRRAQDVLIAFEQDQKRKN